MAGQLTIVETILRVLVALGPAVVIGLERELAYQPAGLRTHVLLGLGAALFTLAGLAIADVSPSRIAAQVASGVGFLGAGVILHEGLQVRGLTTAASLWVTAALGVAAGAGAYLAVGTVTIVALIVLTVLKWVEREMFPWRRGQALAVDLGADVAMCDALAAVERIAGPVQLRQIERVAGGGQRLVGQIHLSRSRDLVSVAEEVRTLPGVTGVDLAR